MTPQQQTCKRAFDVVVAAFGLLFAWPIIVIAIVLVRGTTGEPGLFAQVRVGRQGKLFRVIKIRTMTSLTSNQSTVTIAGDPRISKVGRFLRSTKVDELPQLWNVLKGEMSLVGPRPDVPRQVKLLKSDAALVLSVRPGITGPASLRYRNEERLLSLVSDPSEFNDRLVFPNKISINKTYIREYSFLLDLRYLVETIWSRGPSAEDLLTHLRNQESLLDCEGVNNKSVSGSNKLESVI